MLNQLVTLWKGAKVIDMPEHTIRDRLKRGEIKGLKLGRDWFLYAHEVQRLAKEYPVRPLGNLD